jgi:RimJ/RimL family protein N-acetyltransferase
VTALLVRELHAGDRHALAFIFARLGAESRYRRFHAIVSELTPQALDRLTDVDHWHSEALIAWSPLPRAPIGVARYVRCAEFDVAELAVAVTDAWQRRGVGTRLTAALRLRAQAAGIRRFRASVLADNRAALALARGLGTELVADTRHGVVELSVGWDRAPEVRARPPALDAQLGRDALAQLRDVGDDADRAAAVA